MKLPRNPINGWLMASVPAPERGKMGWVPCMAWCQEKLDGEFLQGVNAARSYSKNWRYIGEGVFEFRRADDHMMFLLRWR